MASLLAAHVGKVVLALSTTAQAQCTMDTQCEQALICDNGACVAPPPVAPAVTAPPPPVAPPVTIVPPPAAPPVTVAPVTVAPVTIAPPLPQPWQRPVTPRVRYSKPMMVVGEATLVVGSAVFVVGLFQLLGDLLVGAGCGARNPCISDHLVLGAAIATAGIPLIIIGSEKVRAQPKPAATISPWVGLQSAGLSLRLGL